MEKGVENSQSKVKVAVYSTCSSPQAKLKAATLISANAAVNGTRSRNSSEARIVSVIDYQ